MKKFIRISIAALLVFLVCFAGLWVYVRQHYEVPILMYHSLDVSRIGGYAVVSPQKFHEQMRFIKTHGYTVIALADYCRMLNEGRTISGKYVVITFDDGYKDNLAAIQILKEFGFPATIFIIANRIGTDGHMSKEDIAWFLRNTDVAIGSHTLTHPDFSDILDLQLKKEVAGSKRILEGIFSREVVAFSFPTGIFTEKALREVESAGYMCACTTNRGFSKKLDRFMLRRIKVTNTDNAISLWAKLSGYYNVFRRLRDPA